MTVLTDLALLVAGPGAGGAQHWGGGWPWLWGPLTMVIWVAVIGAVVWLLFPGVWSRDRAAGDRARHILDERYARGELTSDEYRERLDQLR